MLDTEVFPNLFLVNWKVAGEGYVHVVTLTNLQPDTRYYFTIGASATRRFDKISSTKTAPEPGTAYRIFTISDIHGNARNNWSNMQDFICNLNNGERLNKTCYVLANKAVLWLKKEESDED